MEPPIERSRTRTTTTTAQKIKVIRKRRRPVGYKNIEDEAVKLLRGVDKKRKVKKSKNKKGE